MLLPSKRMQAMQHQVMREPVRSLRAYKESIEQAKFSMLGCTFPLLQIASRLHVLAPMLDGPLRTVAPSLGTALAATLEASCPHASLGS